MIVPIPGQKLDVIKLSNLKRPSQNSALLRSGKSFKDTIHLELFDITTTPVTMDREAIFAKMTASSSSC